MQVVTLSKHGEWGQWAAVEDGLFAGHHTIGRTLPPDTQGSVLSSPVKSTTLTRVWGSISGRTTTRTREPDCRLLSAQHPEKFEPTWLPMPSRGPDQRSVKGLLPGRRQQVTIAPGSLESAARSRGPALAQTVGTKKARTLESAAGMGDHMQSPIADYLRTPRMFRAPADALPKSGVDALRGDGRHRVGQAAARIPVQTWAVMGLSAASGSQ